MRLDEFEDQMRALEMFHTFRLLPGAWAILRLDGRGFSRFTESRFEKPFGAYFHDCMVQTAQAILEDFQGSYAYTESYEISVLFPRHWKSPGCCPDSSLLLGQDFTRQPTTR